MLIISIILEAGVAAIAVLAARQGRPYLYGLAFTFAAYVVYDLHEIAACAHRRRLATFRDGDGEVPLALFPRLQDAAHVPHLREINPVHGRRGGLRGDVVLPRKAAFVQPHPEPGNLPWRK